MPLQLRVTNAIYSAYCPSCSGLVCLVAVLWHSSGVPRTSLDLSQIEMYWLGEMQFKGYFFFFFYLFFSLFLPLSSLPAPFVCISSFHFSFPSSFPWLSSSNTLFCLLFLRNWRSPAVHFKLLLLTASCCWQWFFHLLPQRTAGQHFPHPKPRQHQPLLLLCRSSIFPAAQTPRSCRQQQPKKPQVLQVSLLAPQESHI